MSKTARPLAHAGINLVTGDEEVKLRIGDPGLRLVPKCVQGGCDDGDPCTENACDPAKGCGYPAVAGLASASCVCKRAAVHECVGHKVPRSIRERTTTACKLVGRAEKTHKPKKARHLVALAAQSWKKAAAVLDRPKTQKALPPECVKALRDSLGDARLRAERQSQ
jgi:hypothetical protein